MLLVDASPLNLWVVLKIKKLLPFSNLLFGALFHFRLCQRRFCPLDCGFYSELLFFWRLIVSTLIFMLKTSSTILLLKCLGTRRWNKSKTATWCTTSKPQLLFQPSPLTSQLAQSQWTSPTKWWWTLATQCYPHHSAHPCHTKVCGVTGSLPVSQPLSACFSAPSGSTKN